MTDAFANYPSLKGKTVFLTGGATGIGAEIVRAFAAQGARVGFLDVDASGSAAIAAGTGADIAFEICDLRDIGALRQGFAALRAKLGPATVLVNSAARDDRHIWRDVTPEYWDERLSVKQVKRICERLEERYGYKKGEHQRVIVEHIKDGRQHFHVMWNRVSLKTGKPHYPYMHKKQSILSAREMEIELGLKKTGRGRVLKARTIRLQRSLLAKDTFKPDPTLNKTHTKQSFGSKETPKATSHQMMPQRPSDLSGMCEAQRIDFKAACEGKITWQQYFMKWGRGLVGLSP